MTGDTMTRSMSVREFESWKLYYLDKQKKEQKALTEARAKQKLRK